MRLGFLHVLSHDLNSKLLHPVSSCQTPILTQQKQDTIPTCPAPLPFHAVKLGMKPNHLEHSVTASCPTLFANLSRYTVFPLQTHPSFTPAWSWSDSPIQAFPPAQRGQGHEPGWANEILRLNKVMDPVTSEPSSLLGLSCDSFTTIQKYHFDTMLWIFLVICDSYRTPELKNRQFKGATGPIQTTIQVKSNPLLFSCTLSPQCHSLIIDISCTKATQFSLLSKQELSKSIEMAS